MGAITMLEKAYNAEPPKGIRRIIFRLPVYLYRYHLGFLMGERFIRLKHWGRKSGQLKEAVIEVIDKDNANAVIHCASGFGEKSQWYKNICANPDVFITLKNRDFRAKARILPHEEAALVLRRYAMAHPKSFKAVAKLSGYRIDGSDSDIVEFSRVIRIIAFSEIC